MNVWHGTDDAPRVPRRVSPTQPVDLTIGTWPIARGLTAASASFGPSIEPSLIFDGMTASLCRFELSVCSIHL